MECGAEFADVGCGGEEGGGGFGAVGFLSVVFEVFIEEFDPGVAVGGCCGEFWGELVVPGAAEGHGGYCWTAGHFEIICGGIAGRWWVV